MKLAFFFWKTSKCIKISPKIGNDLPANVKGRLASQVTVTRAKKNAETRTPLALSRQNMGRSAPKMGKQAMLTIKPKAKWDKLIFLGMLPMALSRGDGWASKNVTWTTTITAFSGNQLEG